MAFKALLVVLLIRCCSTQNITTYFVGQDGNWNNASNWDPPEIPHNTSYHITLPSGTLWIPPHPSFGSLSCLDGLLNITSDATIDGEVFLLNSCTLAASASLAGEGTINGGTLYLYGGRVHIPLVNPRRVVLSAGAFVDYIRVKHQYLQISGGMGEESIGFLDMNNANLDTDAAVRCCSLVDSTISNDIKVTGSAVIGGSLFFLGYTEFTNGSGVVDVREGAVMRFNGEAAFRSKLYCSQSCSFMFPGEKRSVMNSFRPLYFYGDVIGLDSNTTIMLDIGYEVHIAGKWSGRIDGGALVVIEAGASFEGPYELYLKQIEINTPITLPYLKIEDLVINSPNVEISHMSTQSIVSFYNASFGLLEAPGALSLVSQDCTFIIQSLNLNGSTFIDNTTIIVYQQINTSIGVIEMNDALFINYADWDSKSVDVHLFNSIFANFGRIILNSWLIIRPVNSSSGQFVNGGTISLLPSYIAPVYLEIDPSIPFYQCDSGIITLVAHSGGLPQLHLNNHSIINGLIEFKFPHVYDYPTSTNGVNFAMWGNSNGVPLSGNAITYIESPLNGSVCLNTLGSTSSFAIFYPDQNAPLSPECQNFVPNYVQNDICSLYQPSVPCWSLVSIPGTCLNGTWIISNSSLKQIITLKDGTHIIYGDVEATQLRINNSLVFVKGSLKITNGSLSLFNSTLIIKDNLSIFLGKIVVDTLSHIIVQGAVYLDHTTIVLDLLHFSFSEGTEVVLVSFSQSTIGTLDLALVNSPALPCPPTLKIHPTSISVVFDSTSCAAPSNSPLIGGVVGGVLAFLIAAGVSIFLYTRHEEEKAISALAVDN